MTPMTNIIELSERAVTPPNNNSWAPERDLMPQILSSTILVVDDNQINLIFLERSLRSQGFTNILRASSAEEALEIMNQTMPEIILLDVIMPGGMDGYSCCKYIRRHPKFYDLPVFIQTTLTEANMRVEAFACGATDFVSKPIHPEELCARVMVHLTSRHSMRALQLYKTRIAVELESARQLQLAILPTEAEIDEMKSKHDMPIASYFEPSSEIGGDFWGVKNLTPDQSALWLVDLSGHGVASALNAFRLHAYLKEPSSLTGRPGEYLSYLNKKLHQLLTVGQFATMFYGIIDKQTNQLYFACASIPHPMVLRHATGQVEVIDGSGTLLGIGEHLYPTQTIPFAAGDRLFLYSDALIETPNTNGTYITEDNIAELLHANSHLPVEIMKQKIVDYFKTHASDHLRDDLTILICARSIA